jgi:hypothetical protein
MRTLQTLMKEVINLFPGRWYHLGADEVSFSEECGTTKTTYHAFSENSWH